MTRKRDTRWMKAVINVVTFSHYIHVCMHEEIALFIVHSLSDEVIDTNYHIHNLFKKTLFIMNFASILFNTPHDFA